MSHASAMGHVSTVGGKGGYKGAYNKTDKNGGKGDNKAALATTVKVVQRQPEVEVP